MDLAKSENNKTARTLVVLGSGGHTMEMSEIIQELNKTKYSPRLYVLAKGDQISRYKIEKIEKNAMQNNENDGDEADISFVNILRSRHVNQSYLSSIITTFLALIECIPLCYRFKPDLILCNGPGTCVPICLIAFILKLFHLIPKCKIVYIESFCRVQFLSLSGKILIKIADIFVVQWPDLLLKYKNRSNVKYYGRLM